MMPASPAINYVLEAPIEDNPMRRNSANGAVVIAVGTEIIRQIAITPIFFLGKREVLEV